MLPKSSPSSFLDMQEDNDIMVLNVKLKVPSDDIIKGGAHGCPGGIEEGLPHAICPEVELVEAISEYTQLLGQGVSRGAFCPFLF